MAADDPARSALARVPWRRIPGFRRASAWRATVAVLGYAGIALLALALRNPVSIVLYLASALAFVAVVTNAEAIRSRLPGTRLEGRPGVNATILWSVGLLGVGFVAWAAGVPPSGTAQPRPSASQPQAAAAIPTVAPSATAPLAPTATTPPEPTPTAPTVAPTLPPAPSPTTAPPAAPALLDAPVLGGTRTAWIRAKGNPTPGIIGDLFERTVEVAWWPVDAPPDRQRARHIELLISGSGVPVADARRLAAMLVPPDSQAIRTYIARGGQTVEVFRSEVLARAVPAADTYGGEVPGTFIRIAERGAPTTSRVVIGLGDNP